jgi:hypothetical protein
MSLDCEGNEIEFLHLAHVQFSYAKALVTPIS